MLVKVIYFVTDVANLFSRLLSKRASEYHLFVCNESFKYSNNDFIVVREILEPVIESKEWYQNPIFTVSNESEKEILKFHLLPREHGSWNYRWKQLLKHGLWYSNEFQNELYTSQYTKYERFDGSRDFFRQCMHSGYIERTIELCYDQVDTCITRESCHTRQTFTETW